MGCCMSGRTQNDPSTPLLSDATDDTFAGHISGHSSMTSNEEKSDQPLSSHKSASSDIPGGMTVNQSYSMVIASPTGPQPSSPFAVDDNIDPLSGAVIKSPPMTVNRRGNAQRASPLGNFLTNRPQTLREDEELVDCRGDVHINRYYNETRNANLSITSKYSDLSTQPIHPNAVHHQASDSQSLYSEQSHYREQSQYSEQSHLRTSFDTQQSQISWDEPTERGSFNTDLLLPTDEPTPEPLKAVTTV